MYKSIILVVVSILFTGCATISAPTQPIYPSREIVDIPTLNEIHEAELGDTIVSKGVLYTNPSMTLLNEVRSAEERNGWLGAFLVVPAGELIAKGEDSVSTYYYSDRFEFHHWGKAYNSGGGLRVFQNGSVELFSSFTGGYSFSTAPNVRPEYKLKKVRAIEQKGFQQELIYNGRVGNSVKFMYRELSDDLMRPAFSQEIQYDLNESKMIGFKGVRVEIIEATNTHLKYKVIQSFPSID